MDWLAPVVLRASLVSRLGAGQRSLSARSFPKSTPGCGPGQMKLSRSPALLLHHQVSEGGVTSCSNAWNL